jgi:hypothetical protein
MVYDAAAIIFGLGSRPYYTTRAADKPTNHARRNGSDRRSGCTPGILSWSLIAGLFAGVALEEEACAGSAR